MDPLYVLHVTDLHIDDPKAETVDNQGPEWLRIGKYKEYVNELVAAIKSEIASPIHGVAVTGDFVNFGKTEHFSHAAVVINYLLDRLGLSAKNAAMCLGNHDVPKALEQKGDWANARQQVNEFMRKYANAVAVKDVDSVRERALLCKVHDKIWCLMIDSLKGCEETKAPGPGTLFLPHEADGVMELVDQVPQDELLIVGSHYTIVPDVGRHAAWEDEQPDWYERHVWTEATPIRERIERVRSKQNCTVWVCGDIHREGQTENNGVHYITTGRLGTRSNRDSESSILRQAKVIEYSDRGIRVLRANFLTTDARAQYGDWRAEWVSEESGSAVSKVRAPAMVPPTGTGESAQQGQGKSANDDVRVDVINEESEQDILRAIRDKRLCKWGRFATSGSEVLLSWVSIGPLLNVPGRLGATIDEMDQWLAERLDEHGISASECLLIGADCWGGVLASQLSVLSGAANFCVAARGRGEYHTLFEGVNDEVISTVKGSRAIVLISDVVATGRTQRWIYESITKNINDDQAGQLYWFSLSVLTDPAQLPVVDYSFIEARATSCRMKRPFLPSDRVPDDEMIPNEISLV